MWRDLLSLCWCSPDACRALGLCGRSPPAGHVSSGLPPPDREAMLFSYSSINPSTKSYSPDYIGHRGLSQPLCTFDCTVLPGWGVWCDAGCGRMTGHGVCPPAASAAPTSDPGRGGRCEGGATLQGAQGGGHSPLLSLERDSRDTNQNITGLIYTTSKFILNYFFFACENKLYIVCQKKKCVNICIVMWQLIKLSEYMLVSAVV